MKIYSDKAEKPRQLQLEETNQKYWRKKEHKTIPRQNQTIHTKQDFPKQQKKILPTIRGRMGEDITASGCEWGKKIWSKIWERKYYNKNAE